MGGTIPPKRMGNQATATVRYDGETHEAKVLLETDEVIVRGGLKLKIPFRDIREAKPAGGTLVLRWKGHELRVPLGGDAAKWAEKIRNPKSRVEKLGVKAKQKVCAIGSLDGEFLAELEKSGADVSRKLRRDSDAIFAAVERGGDLAFERWRQFLQAAGSIWVVRPKGNPAITEMEVMQAGRAAGLVDVKVVRFSATHTAEKFVIPLTRR